MPDSELNPASVPLPGILSQTVRPCFNCRWASVPRGRPQAPGRYGPDSRRQLWRSFLRNRAGVEAFSETDALASSRRLDIKQYH